MNYYTLNILDQQQLLSELDRHQIENLVWLRLASVRESVSSVDFEFSQHSAQTGGSTHFVTQISTELSSGKTIHVHWQGDNKLDSILTTTDRMGESTIRQIKLERRFLYRSWSYLSSWFDKPIVNTKQTMAALLLSISEPFVRLSESQVARKRQNPRI